LSGCNFDESFERNQEHDGDDIDVIKNIWPQALDKAFFMEDDASLDQWSDQSVQNIQTVQTVPVDIIQQPTDIQTPTVQAPSAPINSQPRYESEDQYETEND
jgi:hypothetical protein